MHTLEQVLENLGGAGVAPLPRQLQFASASIAPAGTAAADPTARQVQFAPRSSKLQRAVDYADKHHTAVVLIVLALIELLLFGPVVNAVGFYLDDWRALSIMKQAPHNLFGLVSYYFAHEPKIVNRPLELLHFGGLFLLFGTKPLFYHIVNGIMEVLSGWCLYRCLDKLTRNRMLAAVAAVLLLVYPTHDATHYWMVSSSVTLSLVLYLLSLEWTIDWAAGRGSKSLVAATISFALSLFNYEVFLPLLAVNAVVASVVSLRDGKAIKPSLMRGLTVGALLAFCVALYVAYLKILALFMPTAWLHGVAIDMGAIATTVVSGTRLSISSEPFSYAARVITSPGGQPDLLAAIRMLAIGSLTATLAVLFGKDRSSWLTLCWTGVGAVALTALSYTIFGLNPEYQPTLVTLVNRINAGGAVGASILFATLACIVGHWISASPKSALRAATASVVAAALVVFFSTTDYATAKSWMISQTVQKHAMQLVKQNADAVKTASCLLLIDCPRYVYCAPVFDGTWDFESAVKVTLNDYNVKAGVVSERLEMDADGVSDISRDYLCGRFPTRNMLLLDAPHSKLIPVNSSEQFIAAVKENGLGFDLDRRSLNRWRRELVWGKSLADRVKLVRDTTY